jgi:hypothetical protein
MHSLSSTYGTSAIRTEVGKITTKVGSWRADQGLKASPSPGHQATARRPGGVACNLIEWMIFFDDEPRAAPRETWGEEEGVRPTKGCVPSHRVNKSFPRRFYPLQFWKAKRYTGYSTQERKGADMRNAVDVSPHSSVVPRARSGFAPALLASAGIRSNWRPLLGVILCNS